MASKFLIGFCILIVYFTHTSQAIDLNAKCHNALHLVDRECRLAQRAFEELNLGTFRKHIPAKHYRSWQYPKDLESSVKSKANIFEYNIDVVFFKPSEINVQVKEAGILIEAKHGEKKEYQGNVTRRIMWRFPLPENVKPEDVVAAYTLDGVLTVSASEPIKKKAKSHNVPLLFVEQKFDVKKAKEAENQKFCDKDVCDE